MVHTSVIEESDMDLHWFMEVLLLWWAINSPTMWICSSFNTKKLFIPPLFQCNQLSSQLNPILKEKTITDIFKIKKGVNRHFSVGLRARQTLSNSSRHLTLKVMYCNSPKSHWFYLNLYTIIYYSFLELLNYEMEWVEEYIAARNMGKYWLHKKCVFQNRVKV